MEILEKIDWNVLNDYISNDLITINKHPEYNLWILNYSPKAQFKKFWDIYTKSCRGLVIDEDGNIIARPFQKFKNIEEHDPSEIDMSKKYEIFEKMDGSLIILFYYEPRMEWIVATRGSFISKQSIEAKKMLNASVYNLLNKNCTYLFEIIYPENRIVVDYGDTRELILLSVIHTRTGIEFEYDEMVNKYSNNFKIVKRLNIKDINNLYDLKKLEENNKEGFVVKFSDGFRVKIKFNEYIQLHGILTNVSTLTIWEFLKNNYDFNALFNIVPDEYYKWLKKTKNNLINDYNEIERKSLKEFIRIYHINDIKERKDFANEAIKTKYPSILFKLYDKRPYDDIIWKMIKPQNSKLFRDDL